MLSHYPTSLHEYCNFWFPEIFTDKEVIMFAALTNTDKDTRFVLSIGFVLKDCINLSFRVLVLVNKV